jgi:hypothetical protein
VHPKNRTKYKTLNRIASNPKVQEIWDEDVNGLYIALNEGWNLDGLSCFWGSTVKQLISSFGCVEKGEPH